jgi:hypothetical protein
MMVQNLFLFFFFPCPVYFWFSCAKINRDYQLFSYSCYVMLARSLSEKKQSNNLICLRFPIYLIESQLDIKHAQLISILSIWLVNLFFLFSYIILLDARCDDVCWVRSNHLYCTILAKWFDWTRSIYTYKLGHEGISTPLFLFIYLLSICFEPILIRKQEQNMVLYSLGRETREKCAVLWCAACVLRKPMNVPGMNETKNPARAPPITISSLSNVNGREPGS